MKEHETGKDREYEHSVETDYRVEEARPKYLKNPEKKQGEVYSVIRKFIEENGGKCLPFYAPVDVRLDCDDKTMVQPDVLILCDESKRTKRYIMGAPDFCLEILSKSTRRKDCIKKLQKYTDAGVKEYWIIDPYTKTLLVYHWKDDYTPHMYPLEGKVGLALYDERLSIDLNAIADLIVDDKS